MSRFPKVLVFVFLFCSAFAGFGQNARLNFYSSYVFDDSFETYNSSTNYYSGKVKGGYQWGAGVEFKVKDDYGVELLYFRQDTKANTAYYNLAQVERQIDLGVNYALVGFNKYIQKDKLEPFGGLLLGAMFASDKNPQPSEESSITKFALGFRLGTNIWASDRVAIKLQAQLLTSVQGLGGGIYFGTGGAGTGVSTYSTITQMCLGGGLTFKLGE
jgi:hypothetical protein